MSDAAPDDTSFPPPGWVDRDGAARVLGISRIALAKWQTRGRVRCGIRVTAPDGLRRVIYPVAELERVRAEVAAARASMPDGFVGKDAARRMLGVSMAAFMGWEREGKLTCGAWAPPPAPKRRKIYPIAELERLRAELRGPGRVYREANSSEYHIPAGYVRRQDACEMFGVDRKVWDRWEREGHVPRGRRFGYLLKLYPAAELDRLLAECGRYAPPYPDPDRPGVYRVPLAGTDIRRREALVDAADLPLVEGWSWHWSEAAGPNHMGHVQRHARGGGASSLRQILLGVSGADGRVGHLNDDPLDCRRANLVLRTASESGAAKRKPRVFAGRPCSSRYKGVCFDRSRGKWVANIKAEGRCRHLGRFRDEVAAAQAYDEAAVRWFGVHARLNFPDGVDAALARDAEAAAAAAAASGGVPTTRAAAAA